MKIRIDVEITAVRVDVRAEKNIPIAEINPPISNKFKILLARLFQ